MATNPFDTDARLTPQRAGNFQASSRQQPVANKYQPLIDSVSKVANDEGLRSAERSAEEETALGIAAIASNEATIEDLTNNGNSTAAYKRGAQVMSAKSSVSSTIAKFQDKLNDEEFQRTSPAEIDSAIAQMITDTNTGDTEIDNMVKKQLAVQSGDLKAKHRQVHNKRNEEDTYIEGVNYLNSGLRQITSIGEYNEATNPHGLTDDQRSSMIQEMMDGEEGVLRFMLTEDQQKAVVSHALVTALELGDVEDYVTLRPYIDKVGGLTESQLNRVNQSHAQAKRRLENKVSFENVVEIAELERSVSDMDDGMFYEKVKAAHDSGLITPSRSEKLIMARQEAQLLETKLTVAGSDLMVGNSVRAEMLTSDQQQAAFAKSYSQLQSALQSRGLTGDELQAATQGAWTSILTSNPNMVEKQTSDRMVASVNAIQSGQFTDANVNDLRLAYEFHKNNPALLAGYVPTKEAQATVLNYGKMGHLSADSLMNMVQRDRRAEGPPNNTPAQTGQINTLASEYRSELEGRESGWLPWNWGAQDPDNIASAGYLDLVNDLAARNLRTGLYVDADAAFEAAKVEAQTGTENILGYTVPTGQVSMSNRLLTSIDPEFAISKYLDSVKPELADGDKQFLEFDTTARSTLSVVKRHADGFTETVNTVSLLEIGKYAEDNKSKWADELREFERDKLTQSGTTYNRRLDAWQSLTSSPFF